ncbi:MAG TPA: hypothetical protein VEU76_06445, partial [Candidatus Udaeobacter sp.]|nr:hypothetical protein [Candidatus Udaeobacter sp.]
MNLAKLLPAVALAIVLTTSCLPGQGGASSSSPAAGPKSPIAQSSAGACSQLGTNLEIVRLKGSTTFVVRDITNILNPQTVATFDGSAPQFINQTDVSFVRGPALMRMSVCGPPAVAVIASPAHGLYQDSYAWSPDGASVAYVTSAGTTGELHILSGGHDQTLATVPGLVASQSCASQSCADQSDIRLLYSPDGADISFV